MTNKNIQMKKREGNDWDNLFPLSLNENIYNEDGKNLNSQLNDLENEIETSIVEVNNELNELNDKTVLNKKRVNEIYVNVLDYGAKGDGVHDDRQAIQLAIDEVDRQGGGTVYFPATSSVTYYMLNSTNSDDCGFTLTKSNIVFKGANRDVRIRANVTMDSIFKVGVSGLRSIDFDTIVIDGNKLVDYCFNGNDETIPYLNWVNANFRSAKETAVWVACFMSVFTNCFFNNSKTGIRIGKSLLSLGAINTSLTFNSCYANDNTEYGFRGNVLTYSTFNSCGVDNMETGTAYYLGCEGVTFNGCGAENVYKIMNLIRARGVVINTFYTQRHGSDDPDNPTDYLFEFGSGTGVTMSGLFFESSSKKNYNYLIGVTGSTMGNELVMITDMSIGNYNEIFGREGGSYPIQHRRVMILPLELALARE